MSHFHMILLIFHNHSKLYFLYSEETYFQETNLYFPNLIQPISTPAVIAASQLPVQFMLFPIQQNKAASARFLNQDLVFLKKGLAHKSRSCFFT